MRGLVIAAAAAAVLAGCQERERTVAGICKPFGEAGAAAPAAGPAVVEDCVHRWAYALAASRDEAGAVAAAVTAACATHLARWNQQALGADGGEPAGDAPSLLTGQTTNPIAERANFANDRALFYVVQARAGGCDPPPRREGSPPMTMPEK